MKTTTFVLVAALAACGGLVDKGEIANSNDNSNNSSDSSSDTNQQANTTPSSDGTIPVADSDNPSEANAWTVAELQSLSLPHVAVVRTVIKGQVLVDIPVVFDGWVASPMTGDTRQPYMHLRTMLSVPFWKQTGDVAAGMSGSPVLINGRLAGALSFSYGGYTAADGATPFLATPIEDMRAADAFSGETQVFDPEIYADYYWGLAETFVSSPSARRYFAHDAKFAKLLSNQLARGGNVSPAPNVAFSSDLRPGSAVAMIFASGDLMQAGAVCTVTTIENGHVRACGHPVTAAGNDLAMPMTPAWVNDVLASPVWGVFKDVVPVGHTLGAFTDDWFTEIAGTLGAVPRTVHVVTVVSRKDGSSTPQTYTHEVSRGAGIDVAAYLTVAGTVAPLDAARGYYGLGSATVDMDVAFMDVPTLTYHESTSAFYDLSYETGDLIYMDLLRALAGSGPGHRPTPIQVTIKIAWSP